MKAAQKELLPDNAQPLDQPEQVLQDDEKPASPSAAAPSPGNPAVDQREPGLPDELDAHGIPIAESALPPGIEYRRRALVVDALRSCQYPAQPHDIATYIRQLRERRQVYLPDNRLYQLISAARELGLINLVQTDAPDTAPYYIFKDDPRLVRRFIEV